jgi:phenylpropionate dioxygenase-like ring-hydroxylating dioxygenase large terminal subunit
MNLSNWPQTLVDAEAFRREQNELSRVWTFLGLARDVARDGDWFRASLATRSVFVQRFGDELKCFENRCAHRSFPLRTSDKGNGAIVCGFHHWRYDRDGRAVGIPMCQELFGTLPRELDARLNQVEIATCGELIFGRFAGPRANESLEQFRRHGSNRNISNATSTPIGGSAFTPASSITMSSPCTRRRSAKPDTSSATT